MTTAPGDLPEDAIRAICAGFGNDRHRMLDILLGVQARQCWISPAAMETIAAATGLTRIAVEGVASFYSFLSLSPKGRVPIRLCDDIVDRFAGLDAVAAAFEAELGIRVGQTTPDGAVSLELTPCIGMCDQAPAAMVGDLVATRLTPDRARALMRALRQGLSPTEALVADHDRLSPLARAKAQVEDNIRQAGEVLLGAVPLDAGIAAARAMTPAAIIDAVETSGLRGCGGAGFTTGRKWRLAASAPDDHRVVICNADEGEPGTFKDRVLLTDRADLVIEGMAICARAIGGREGILYLRGEYVYLRDHLQDALAVARARGVLGDGFDIRIQLGAGAYVCGEEGALISSCEGLPGEPKTRPPFPVTRGYLGHPTVVNNVETFAHVARILDRGPDWFRAMGTDKSRGTKLFSVSGDCARPGVYELPWGLTLRELLALAGGEDAAAVQVGGPSGTMVGRDGFDRRLGYEDLATGGAVIVFSPRRNILEIVDYYLSFFVHESCGYCTPCRVGNVFLKKAVEKFRKGQADEADIAYLKELSATIIETSRCGLGMTSPNPVLTSLENLPLVWAAVTRPRKDGLKATFDIQAAIEGGRRIARRRSYIFDRDFSE
ncbi:NAD(P)H-dependent oxidoreductase subunit E [Tabrizicola sp. YIM 78059]|uniref:NAD(P)H-dependent oxidoreductase subunit E n=1 Tax=Tabrizicola sp. YIM 78059 TaxID=2529861 RepID=UPI0010AB3872|nr:NAD(P)H-dependent oxidoreductase subunit E [Tabrizicola sp. YIM 78059]